ncbi:hypothetical protein SBDP1_500009 [Syntrophobacter sp. SbD1]|nr:hypothetical protein SBDP1_500009 [Syntrophobacter sp. SbD1]
MRRHEESRRKITLITASAFNQPVQTPAALPQPKTKDLDRRINRIYRIKTKDKELDRIYRIYRIKNEEILTRFLPNTKLRSRRVLGVKGQGRFSPSPARERAGVRAYPRAYPCSVLNANWYKLLFPQRSLR